MAGKTFLLIGRFGQFQNFRKNVVSYSKIHGKNDDGVGEHLRSTVMELRSNFV